MERIIHQGRLIEIVERDVVDNGKERTFEYARRSPGVRVIIPSGDKLLLTREFRHNLGTYDYRLPGGKVYDSLSEYNDAIAAGADIGEAARLAAIKEAAEEVGIDVSVMTPFHKSQCGATVIWDLFYFVADTFEHATQDLKDTEDISVEEFTREEAKAMCLDGRIDEERSALVLLRYLSQAAG